MTIERKPHKWAEVIKAWADGKPIQCRIGTQKEWIDWDPGQLRQSNASALFFPFDVPRFDQFEWRVKPENIVIEGEISPNHHFNGGYFCASSTKNNIRLEFDPDTKKLVKAEVIG
nr:MAG TPA: hypothetical protein [Caudoviricetes sp.]